MKIALITTTIHIPSVLALYRRHDPSASVRFFVAIDEKTPTAAFPFLENLGNVQIVGKTEFKCDAVIGWNSIQRRNLALLEALRWGADIIVSVDDDNLCLDPNYFCQFTRLLTQEVAYHVPFSGLKTDLDPASWFDVGTLLMPPATHRGFPVGGPEWPDIPDRFTHVIDAKIGVAAGICLGDPDTSAVERIAKHPNVHGVSEVLKAGIVVDPQTHTVWNSQNTAIIRELAPAWSMWCGVGRYDDIFASLMVQRVMRERGYHVHFGRPLVYQQRNQHDLTRDLAGELWGMQNILNVARALDETALPGKSVIQDTRRCFESLGHLIPPITIQAGLAFLEDCEKIL